MGHDIEFERRTVLKIAAGLTAGGIIMTQAAAAVPVPAPTGKPGDFDFLTGEWKIHHRYLENGTWIEFDGEATVHSLLGGIASIEELRIPVRDFNGMGIRTLDLEKKLWGDSWMNAKSGVPGAPTYGSFVNGVGAWMSDDVDAEGKPIQTRGVWDEITGASHRWHQGISRDGGKTWEDGWIMHWRRA